MVFPTMNFKWKRQRAVHKMAKKDTSIPQALVLADSTLSICYYKFFNMAGVSPTQKLPPRRHYIRENVHYDRAKMKIRGT